MKPSDPLQQPLSLEELGQLESFLLSDLMPEDSLSSIEMVDGYMTALIIGPDVVPPEIWIPYIWNEEKSDVPCFSSEAEADMIEELLVRHMNTITLQFLNEPDEFLPLYETFSYSDDQEQELAVENWALGFTMGMELTHKSWSPLFEDEDTGMLAMPMLILSKLTDDYNSLSEKDLSDMTQLLPTFVIKIYKYWKQYKP
ncbi:MAG: UPF0149 family protein [Chlorobiaceae bacterium]|nr:UPF0149 family protein [Chlorobiaceae bacterium]NTV17467.1 UPF0149 family protein [Chlorobiaceae bacterium]